ncbi:2-methoxy-6-polyprenyl-1,4-benzoquinol methylase [Cricetulus griseus]|uniref:2-methoxy-6-polyprenyl-1,4-benzoquinol methylase n=1 Tax=Cricetulus griseus TaxID=10029 RepID=A0A061I4H9_CRIGR|nr:2-methoxy-6-polyprenyl-1,4-benzoquinol methylase [Cricetulus griseus]
MAAPRSCGLWRYCCRGWSCSTGDCRLPRLHRSWARATPSARLLSQEKRAAETHFGFETVSEEEKGGKVYQVFESVAKKYDVMNDMMSLGIHRAWKDLLIKKMHPLPGTQLLDVAGGTGDIAFRFLTYVQAQHQRKRRRQLRAQQNLSWEEIAKKYQNEEDPLGGSLVMVCDINREMLKVGKQKALDQGHTAADACNMGLYDLYSFQVIPVIGEVIAGDWKSYQYLVESIRKFPNQEEFKEMIEDAGFQKVTYESLTTGIVAIHSGFKL